MPEPEAPKSGNHLINAKTLRTADGSERYFLAEIIIHHSWLLSNTITAVKKLLRVDFPPRVKYALASFALIRLRLWQVNKASK